METQRPTRANGRAKRRAILSAALEVFATHGYRGTSLTEIAKRVGMTQPGLLHHFGTKEQLLLEVVDAQEVRTAEEVSKHLRGDSTQLHEAIRTLGALNQHLPVEQMLLATLSTEAVHAEHPLHDHFKTIYQGRRRELAALIAQQQSAGRLRDDIVPEALAREIIATLDGLRLQWLLDPERVHLDEALQAYAGRIEQEFSAPNPSHS